MKITHLIASLAIVGCTPRVAWFIPCHGHVPADARVVANHAHTEVAGVWNPALEQKHPEAWFETLQRPRRTRCLVAFASVQRAGRFEICPETARAVPAPDPMTWTSKAEYEFVNPTRIPQTVYFSFPLPAGGGKTRKGFEVSFGRGNGAGNQAGPVFLERPHR